MFPVAVRVSGRVCAAKRCARARRRFPASPIHSSATCFKDDLSVDPGVHQTPIVGFLWEARQKAAAKRAAGQILFERNDDGVLVKKPKDSATAVTYRFSTDLLLAETYCNPWGNVRVSRILEDLDALAGTN